LASSHLCELCSTSLSVSKVYSHNGLAFYVCDQCSGDSTTAVEQVDLNNITQEELKELLTEEVVTFED